MNILKLKLQQIENDLDDIARCCYYAKSFNWSNDVEVQLDRILEILGVDNPKKVGLSNSILEKRK